MNRFRVWAPSARTVDVEVSGRSIAMEPVSGGWWTVEVEDAGAGTDYAYALDGTAALPDPRSPWQPDGVHAPSRVVDHAAFSWSDRGWSAPPLSSGVVYELHVGTFSPEGTFDGAIDRLDHLVDLGVTHVELMPVAAFPGRWGWGYDGVALWAPDESYGGPDGLKRLVDACHGRGLAVLLDVVYNHLGPDGNHLGRFGPYFTDRYVTPWGDAVNLDGPGSDEVRRFFFDNARMWLRDYHLDGLRVDAVHSIVDTSARHFLEELADEVFALEPELGRHLVLLAENDRNDPRVAMPREVGGSGFTAQWNEDFHHALHALLTGEREGYYADFGSITDVADCLEHGLVYDGKYSNFRGRRHGRSARGVPGDRSVGCAQNHDQVGNRARGERLSHLVSEGRVRIAAALVLTAPFVPMLFQGEEWGASTSFCYFTDHSDAELAASVREGRRREFAAFGWDPDDIPDPQDGETFERSRLRWDEREEPWHAEMVAWYAALIRLRRSTPDLLDGDPGSTRVRHDETEGWLVVERGSVAVVCNLGHRNHRVPFAHPEDLRVLSSWGGGPRTVEGAVEVSAESVAILQTGNG
ncbi:MAG TPA: malto-oligosyltrehalose trehalohydrolase [Candidatus Krumholzibacteria bacterium]|nr:malto-oligosyltrehalose trehalohydrolase [Candidatus Krumholzibacteria bacterium]